MAFDELMGLTNRLLAHALALAAIANARMYPYPWMSGERQASIRGI